MKAITNFHQVDDSHLLNEAQAEYLQSHFLSGLFQSAYISTSSANNTASIHWTDLKNRIGCATINTAGECISSL